MLRTALPLAALLATPALAQQAEAPLGTPQLQVAETAGYGPHLVDEEGRALYLFTADTQGGAEAAPNLACTGECIQKWPPMDVAEMPEGGAGVDESLIGTVEWEGTMVATYNGWPLYYYALDAGADHGTGQDVQSYGGEWYLVTPDGTELHSG